MGVGKAPQEKQTDHDGDVVSVREGQWTVLSQQVVLSFHKCLQVLGVEAHHLMQMFKPVVLQERFYEHHLIQIYIVEYIQE